MPIADYRPGEISDLGEKIYREKLKRLVYPAEKGKFLIIDVESGDYEIDEDALTATQRLRQRRPQAVNYGVKSATRRFSISAAGRVRTMIRGAVLPNRYCPHTPHQFMLQSPPNRSILDTPKRGCPRCKAANSALPNFPTAPVEPPKSAWRTWFRF